MRIYIILIVVLTSFVAEAVSPVQYRTRTAIITLLPSLVSAVYSALFTNSIVKMSAEQRQAPVATPQESIAQGKLSSALETVTEIAYIGSAVTAVELALLSYAMVIADDKRSTTLLLWHLSPVLINIIAIASVISTMKDICTDSCQMVSDFNYEVSSWAAARAISTGDFLFMMIFGVICEKLS
ncbi:MAG: hypothetical protein WCK49_02865 [Myxococcaceae bacterium]